VVPAYDSTFTAFFTNLPIVTPYRGAGRQHGVFVIERLLDLAAFELKIDPAEIRRRNFIPADAFPYQNEIIFQDFQPLEYDSGNYEPVLDKALAAIGYAEFTKHEQPNNFVRKAVMSALASPAMSKAPASVPTKAPRCRCRPLARSMSRLELVTQGQRAFYQLCANRRRPTRRRCHRSRYRHRRHRPVLLGSGDIRQPRRGGRRQCGQ